MRIRPAILLCAALVLAPAAPASALGGDLKQITRDHHADMQRACREMGGRLRIDWRKFETRLDITGDGIEDLIWHATPDAVSCQGASSAFCGTGGCSMLVVANGRKPFEFLAQDWSLGKLTDGSRLLLIGIHWAECNYADECRRILKWNPGKQTFESIGLAWHPQRED